MPSYSSSHSPDSPSLPIHTKMIAPGVLGVKIIGRLDSMTTGNIWRVADQEIGRTSPQRIVVDVSEMVYCDGSGMGFLFELRRRQQKAGGKLEILGLLPKFQHLLDLFDPSEFEEIQAIKPKSISFAEKIGRATCQICEHAYALIEFMGEAGAALVQALLNPKQVRWKDAFLAAIAAVLWANYSHSTYQALWHKDFSSQIGRFALSKSIVHWIDEALMALFFFTVGLEIKREFLVGELSSAKKAIPPVMAAVGGMAVPAGLYYWINIGGVGFTMSLFVTGLSFARPQYLEYAKLGIISGSILCGFVGFIILASSGKEALGANAGMEKRGKRWSQTI